MSAGVLMASFHPGFRTGTQDAFKGDHELFIDRLVVSSQKKKVDESLLQERTLVPFFEPSDSANTAFEPLERRAHKSPFQQPHHGLKRNAGERSDTNLACSPPKKENQLHSAKHRRGGKPAQGTPRRSDSELSSATVMRSPSATSEDASTPQRVQRKHNRQAESMPDVPEAVHRSPSPPHKREHFPTSSSFDAGKFAGPAFCNSPTPDCLPIPTTSLLMQQAADSLRSRLML